MDYTAATIQTQSYIDNFAGNLITSMTWITGTTLIAYCARNNNAVRVFDYNTLLVQPVSYYHSSQATTVAYILWSSHLASGSLDQKVVIWDYLNQTAAQLTINLG